LLFRRFISHFRERRWADFVTELIVVVGGVFLGIQAANWNDDRLEQEKGRLFVERLTEDLRKDLNSRKALVSYYESVISSGERTVKRLNAESIDKPLELVIDAYRATEYNHRSPTRATFDEIVSTGSLGLLPTEVRQAGLVDYYRYDNSLAMREAVRESPYRLRVRSLLPHNVQTAIRATCSDIFNDTFERVGFNENCELGLPAGQINSAAEILSSDTNLLGDLRLHFSVLNAQLPNFRGEVLILEAAIEALGATQ
jgi:hypothetical protein